MTPTEAVEWARRLKRTGATRGTSEVNAHARVGDILAAELRRLGYEAERTEVYRGRQRIEYKRV